MLLEACSKPQTCISKPTIVWLYYACNLTSGAGAAGKLWLAQKFAADLHYMTLAAASVL